MVGILVIQQPYPKSLSYWYTITSMLWFHSVTVRWAFSLKGLNFWHARAKGWCRGELGLFLYHWLMKCLVLLVVVGIHWKSDMRIGSEHIITLSHCCTVVLLCCYVVTFSHWYICHTALLLRNIYKYYLQNSHYNTLEALKCFGA